MLWRMTELLAHIAHPIHQHVMCKARGDVMLVDSPDRTNYPLCQQCAILFRLRNRPIPRPRFMQEDEAPKALTVLETLIVAVLQAARRPLQFLEVCWLVMRHSPATKEQTVRAYLGQMKKEHVIRTYNGKYSV